MIKKDEFCRVFYANPRNYESLREKALQCGLEVRKFRNKGLGLQVRDAEKKPFLDVEDYVDNHFYAIANNASRYLARVTFMKDPQVVIDNYNLRELLGSRNLEKFVNTSDDIIVYAGIYARKAADFQEFVQLYLNEVYNLSLKQLFEAYQKHKK